MSYVVVVAALFFLTVKGYYGKKTSTYMEDTGDAFRFGALRMLLCMLIGIVLILFEGAAGLLAVEGGMLAICTLAGLCNAAFLTCWLFAVRKCAMVTVDVSCTLGSMIPAVFCALMFSEPILPTKLIGFALILLAAAVLSGYRRTERKSAGVGGLIFVVLSAVSEGTLSLTQQLYKHYYTEGGSRVGAAVYPKSVYHFYTYVFAALALLLILLVYEVAKMRREPTVRCTDRMRASMRVMKKTFLYILIMAVCMFVATYFQTVAANDYGMPPQILYPLIKGGCLITVCFVAMIFYGEKLTRRSVCGTVIALAGIVVMNLL